MNYFLIGLFVGCILGVFMGAFVVKQFNPPDTVINGKVKAKKHSRVDLKTIFNFKKNKDGNN